MSDSEKEEETVTTTVEEEKEKEEENNKISLEEFQKLLVRCEERSQKQAKLVESMRNAYVSISEAKMLLYCSQGNSMEFVDSVNFEEDREASLKIESSNTNNNNCIGMSLVKISEEDKKEKKTNTSSSNEQNQRVAEAFRHVLESALDLTNS